MALYTLLFAGDVMLNGIPPSGKTFADVQREISGVELAFANQEIPLTCSRVATRRKTPEELRRRDQFILKADPGHARYVADAGFDLVSYGNNHAMDYGADGFREMRQLLSQRGVDGTGAGDDLNDAQACAVRVLPDGTKVGLISAMCFKSPGALWKTTPATDTSAGVATFSFGGVINDAAQKVIRSRVRRARRSCDFLVVAVHWGIERQTTPDGYQVALGRALVDAGADVVWGHHPHVLQGAEIYNGKPILYSLGNLVSPLNAETGFIKLIQTEHRRRFSFVPAQIRSGQVQYVKGNAAREAQRRFRELCDAVQKRYPHPKSAHLLD